MFTVSYLILFLLVQRHETTHHEDNTAATADGTGQNITDVNAHTILNCCDVQLFTDDTRGSVQAL